MNDDTGAKNAESQETGREESPGAENAAQCGDKPCMPRPTFSTFVLSLASSALVQLGEVPDPATGKVNEDLPLAKHTIDILNMLREKTANSLDAEESRLIEGLLYELRLKFVLRK